MDNNFRAALATLAPYLPSITALGAGITEMRQQAATDVASAVVKGQKVDRVDPYTVGDGELGRWMAVGVPVDYYRQLELTIRGDAELLEIFKIALAEPVFLRAYNVVGGGPGALCCSIKCAPGELALQYAPILDA